MNMAWSNLREGLGTVFREHGTQSVENSAGLVLISGSDFNKDILGIKSNLGVIRVDDGRERAHNTVSIRNDGIYRRITNDVKELAKMFIFLEIIKLDQL
jgi:hypothetical protein